MDCHDLLTLPQLPEDLHANLCSTSPLFGTSGKLSTPSSSTVITPSYLLSSIMLGLTCASGCTGYVMTFTELGSCCGVVSYVIDVSTLLTHFIYEFYPSHLL
jgi:hypothetical protein